MSDNEFTFDDAMRLRGLDPDTVRKNLEGPRPGEQTGWFVDIREDATREVAEHMGPMTEREALQTARGASINLDHANWSIIIISPTGVEHEA